MEAVTFNKSLGFDWRNQNGNKFLDNFVHLNVGERKIKLKFNSCN